jgi:hypothetical protein
MGFFMESRIHPIFKKSFHKKFITIWLVCAFSLGGGIYLLRHGHATLGWMLALVFSILCFGGLGNLFYKLHTVCCLVCNGKTKTTKDPTKTHWVAICSHCKIEWNLQIGTDND